MTGGRISGSRSLTGQGGSWYDSDMTKHAMPSLPPRTSYPLDALTPDDRKVIAREDAIARADYDAMVARALDAIMEG